MCFVAVKGMWRFYDGYDANGPIEARVMAVSEPACVWVNVLPASMPQLISPISAAGTEDHSALSSQTLSASSVLTAPLGAGLNFNVSFAFADPDTSATVSVSVAAGLSTARVGSMQSVGPLRMRSLRWKPPHASGGSVIVNGLCVVARGQAGSLPGFVTLYAWP